MDWRQWLWDAVQGILPAGSIFGAGSLTESPATKPFMVLRLDADAEELNDGDEPLITSRTAVVWMHDTPGSYAQIDEKLQVVRQALVGPVSDPGAVVCRWLGDSGDLADDSYGTITRNATFELLGGSS